MEDGKILFISQTDKSNGDFCFSFWMDPWHDAWVHNPISQWLCPESSRGNCFPLVPWLYIQDIAQLCSASPLTLKFPQRTKENVFTFSRNRWQHWTAGKTLGLLHLLKINSFFLGQINKWRRSHEVWCLNRSYADCERSPKHMLTSEVLGGSPNSVAFEKSKGRLRNTAHPCNGLLRLHPISEDIKNVFIEGGGGL